MVDSTVVCKEMCLRDIVDIDNKHCPFKTAICSQCNKKSNSQGLVEARVSARRHLPSILTRPKRKVKSRSHMSFSLCLRDGMPQSQVEGNDHGG